LNIKYTSALLAISFVLSSSAIAKDQSNYKDGCRHQQTYAMNFEKHMARMHAALKLTPAQEAGWVDFSSKMKPEEMNSNENQDWSQLNTPDRLDRMLDVMKAREKIMTEHAALVKTFYQTLTADQKKTFDENFMGRRHSMQERFMRHCDRK
jgi:Spy/CpxP family protein refolding chaperone